MAIVLFLAVPLFTIIFQLFEGPGEMWGHIVKNTLVDYTINSLFLLVGCSIFTLLIGVSAAWVVSRYQFRFSRFFEWALILPLAIPSYITAYAYAGFFDYGGTLSLLLQKVNIINYKFDMMNMAGLIFVLSISLFPYVYIVARTVFIYQSGRLIEASKLLGTNERSTFFRVVLPMARPAIVGGLLLVIMEVLNDYGAAKHYGVSTFTTGIFRAWFSLEEPVTAIYLCAILLVIIFGLMGLEKWQRKQKSYSFLAKSSTQLPKIKLKKGAQIAVFIVVFTPFFVGFLLPVLQLCYWAMLTYGTVISSQFMNLSLQSFGIAFLTAFLSTLFALMVIYFPKWNRMHWLKKSGSVAVLGYAIPGAVLAIGVMIPTLMFDKWLIRLADSLFSVNMGLILNGTIVTLIYAYVIRFLAVAYNPLTAGQLKIGSTLSESSQLLGSGVLKSFFKIDFPLLRPALLTAFILTFVDTLKELPLTLILKPYNVETLAVKAYEYASDEQVMEASIPSLFIIATGIIPIVILNRLIIKKQQS